MENQAWSSRCTTIKKFVVDNIVTIRLAAGIISGISLGFILRAVSDKPPTQRDLMYLKFPGEIFIRILRACVLPLMVSSLICSIGSLDLSLSKKIGLKAVVYYTCTTFCAVVMGITVVLTIHPGTKESMSSMEEAQQTRNVSTTDSLLDLVRNLFPPNIIQATVAHYRTFLVVPILSEEDKLLNKTLPPLNEWKSEGGFEEGTNIIGLLVFSIVLGICLGSMGPQGEKMRSIMKCFGEAMMMMTKKLMGFGPVGICFLLAAQLYSVDSIQQLLINLGWYYLTVVVALSLHGFAVLPILYFVITRKNPFLFLLNMSEALFTAFGTASSLGSLPVTIECIEKKNLIDPRVARFVLPIGASMNMDGTALYEAVAVIFIAQIAGVNLTLGNIVALSITVTMAPQGGIMTIAMVLAAIGLSPDYLAYVLPIDWLFDRFRTTINVLGDSFGAGIVHHLSTQELKNLPLAPSSDTQPTELTKD